MSRNEVRVRVNDQIRIKEIRVIGDDGQQLGVMHPREAQRMAEERGLDLVEIAPTARPPVCKFMDYGKYQYEASKRAHQAKKNQKLVLLKEVKLRPKTDEHDYQFKKNHIVRFLSDGHKAKVSIQFRGREVTHTEIGRRMINRLLKEVETLAEVEKAPKMEGYSLITILSPKKGLKPAGGGESSSPKRSPKPTGEIGNRLAPPEPSALTPTPEIKPAESEPSSAPVAMPTETPEAL
ncbi:MAG: translation initiation factor IF-3 [Acidobacteria bacterium]|nr:translation initiation factor IF-3 [Acidobacteriota bacterium]MBI3658011.1 translation initiation factor IF-3 [Acidobacteriota bacterium]